MRSAIAALVALCVLASVPAAAQHKAKCEYGICRVELTGPELLAQAEALVRQRRFAEAEPLIAALGQAPDMKLEARFLAGFSASERGAYAEAADQFKAILADDPHQTRVRLELARAMLGLGQTASADRQFRIAQASNELPPDVAAMVRGARAVIRSKRLWRFDIDFGIAPDSNINNATGNDTVTVLFGSTALPIQLDKNAQATSGTGQTGMISAGVRLPVSDRAALLLDIDANGTNYRGTRFDDYLTQVAAGAQFSLSDRASLSLQGVGAQRWFGGRVASRRAGVKIGAQAVLSDKQQLGVQLDARRTDALFDPSWDGWQTGLYVNAERAVGQGIFASAGLFARRDWLRAETYSSTELGGSLGIAGELPWGINFGLNGTVSRAVFDAPMPIFSLDPRKDWRFGAQLSLGNRKLRVLGFSPRVSLSFARNSSSLPFFESDRLRMRLALARYF